MAEKKPCEVLAIMVAHRVFREEETKNVHIAGTFNQINAPKFPATHPSLHVFIDIADLPRQFPHKGRTVIRYLDDSNAKEIASFEGEIPRDDIGPTTELEINIGFNGITFPRPGPIEVAFYLDGDLVARRKLQVVLMPERKAQL